MKPQPSSQRRWAGTAILAAFALGIALGRIPGTDFLNPVLLIGGIIAGLVSIVYGVWGWRPGGSGE